MTEFLQALHQGWQALSTTEVMAVGLAVAYLVLAIRQNILCWPAALASSALFAMLMLDAGLRMQALLQGFYGVMAVYGWVNWARRGAGEDRLHVSRWPLRAHGAALLLIALAGLVNGWVLEQYGGEAAHPYLDALTAWAAILATWLVARKILENWAYWFIIDAVSAYLYFSRGLLLTGALFLGYMVLVVVGYRSWLRSMDEAHD